MNSSQSITVIIPTLNEEEFIESLLKDIKSRNSDLEIIVSDGGSRDATVEIARKYAIVLEGECGRGLQMNAAAKIASHDLLWFLHADSIPHPESVQAMKKEIDGSNIVGGAFEYNLNQKGFIYRLTEFFSNKKNHLFKLFYGDMGIFVRKDIFQILNGFKEISLMEDLDFCRRLKKHGSIAIIPLRIETSARRWKSEGAFKNITRNWLLQIGWAMGISAQRLIKWYKFGNGKIFDQSPLEFDRENR